MKAIFTILCLLLGAINFAQNNNQELNNLSIEEQFDFVEKKSYTNKKYQSKFIKIFRYNALKKNTLDTLLLQQSSLLEKSHTIEKNQAQLSQLQEKINSLSKELNTAVKNKDYRYFLGIPTPKGTFTLLLAGTFILFISLAGFFAYKYYENITSAKKSINNFINLQQEFEDHKKSSLKRYQEINRKLQDELNKQWKKDNK